MNLQTNLIQITDLRRWRVPGGQFGKEQWDRRPLSPCLFPQTAPAVVVFAGNMRAIDHLPRAWKLGLSRRGSRARAVMQLRFCALRLHQTFI